MNRLLARFYNYTRNNDEFIRKQSEGFILSVAYFTGSLMCFKYLDKLGIVFGLIAFLVLITLSGCLCFSLVGNAEEHFDIKTSKHRGARFVAVGVIYLSTVCSLGLSLLYHSLKLPAWWQ